MLTSTLIMAAMALALLAAAQMCGADPSQGARRGLWLLLKVTPLLICAFIVVGTLPLVLPPQTIAQWIGHESGWRGLLLGSAAGAVSPGGPLVQAGIGAGLYHAGASLGTVVAYLTAGVLLGVTLMLEEVALLGWRIVLIRVACTFFFPPLAGWLAQTLFGSR